MKILISSDIHVGDYQTYNPTSNFRLRQFDKLSDVLVNICKENDISEFWTCGDLLQVGRPIPIVMYTLKKFLRNFTSNGIRVRTILGNHDVTVRSENTDFNEYDKYSLVSLLRDKDVNIYLDDVVDIDGKKVHFKSWVPSNSFEYKDADILIAHGDVSPKLSPFSQNYIDISKYKRAFVGHIHIPFDSECFVSVGTPIQHSYSDDINTSVIIYDTETDLYNRVPTTGFLRFEYVDNEVERIDRVNETKDEDVIIRVKPQKKEFSIQNNVELDVLGVLDGYLKDIDSSSSEFIRNVMNDVDTSDIVFPDLRFSLKTLKAKNFLSIRNLDWNFEDYHGLNIIEGHIGSGKSTLFRLVQFMFFGHIRGYSKSDFCLVFKDGKKFKGELTLEYNGHQYLIKRGLGELEFFEDGMALESESIRTRQDILENKLSFLKFYSLMYIEQTSNGIFSDMSDTSRVSFLSELCGMNYIRSLTQAVSNAIQERISYVNTLESSISQKQGSVNSINSFVELNKNVVYKDVETINEKVKLIDEKLLNARERVHACNLGLQNIVGIENSNHMLKKRKEDIEKEISNYRVQIAALSQKNTEIGEYLEKHKLIDVQAKIDNLTNALRLNDNKILEINSKTSVLAHELASLEGHPDICPTCCQSWSIDESLVQKLKADISTLNSERDKLNAQKEKNLSELQSIKKYSDTNNNITMYQSELKGNVDRIQGYEARIHEIENEDADITLQNVPNSDVIRDELTKLQYAENVLNGRKNELLQELGSVKLNNDIYDNVQAQKKQKEVLIVDIEDLQNKVNNERTILEKVGTFNSKVLSDKGMLVASLLRKVAESFNTDENLKVETITEMSNGTIRPTLNLQLFVEKYQKYVDYNMLSGGQKLQADIRFLNGLTVMLGSVSIFFMDEIFKYMDDTSIIELSELLKGLNTDKIFLVLHGNLQSTVADRVINCTLTENGSVYE